MDRRRFLLTSLAGALAAPLAAEAQQAGKVYRVGMLLAGERPAQVEALRRGLPELGYIEGQNVVIEVRHAGGRFERLPAIATELIRLKVDVIVAVGSEGVQAAKDAADTVSIVMTYVGDPVDRGFVRSLAHPGGNITGVANLGDELDTKRLELLKEVAPNVRKVAVIFNPQHFDDEVTFAQRGSESLGLELTTHPINKIADLDAALRAASANGADSLFGP